MDQARSLTHTDASGLRRWLQLIAHPVTWLSTVVVVGAALAFASVFVVAAVVFATLAATSHAASSSRVGRLLQHRERANRRARLHAVREARMDSANVSDLEMSELAKRVADIERTSPEDVDRLELDALLDRYVDISIAHARCEAALRRFEQAQAIRTLDPRPDSGAVADDACRRQILVRQRMHRDLCSSKAEGFQLEMLAVVELVELIAVRGAVPELEPEDAEIRHRIMRLDDEDAARRQLEAHFD